MIRLRPRPRTATPTSSDPAPSFGYSFSKGSHAPCLLSEPPRVGSRPPFCGGHLCPSIRPEALDPAVVSHESRERRPLASMIRLRSPPSRARLCSSRRAGVSSLPAPGDPCRDWWFSAKIAACYDNKIEPREPVPREDVAALDCFSDRAYRPACLLSPGAGRGWIGRAFADVTRPRRTGSASEASSRRAALPRPDHRVENGFGNSACHRVLADVTSTAFGRFGPPLRSQVVARRRIADRARHRHVPCRLVIRVSMTARDGSPRNACGP